ncbi:unnamed protein product [Linum tenue]|uniref:Uncharacterized protein n=1 Tax=Linum tenue TaxID=586396 RepID=A0AAV0R5R1_9ROSI|nr:unnamed protein product [Linum tenue]
MEAVDGLVSIPFLLRDMLDWHADSGGDPQPLVEVADAEFVRERDQVTDRELPRFLTEFSALLGFPVSLIFTQILNRL